MTNDEIRKQILGDVVEEFAGVAGEKPTYAEAFVHSFMSAEELHARTQNAISEQILVPPESADEPKPIHFREFL